MLLRLAPGPPGAIRKRFAGRNLRWRWLYNSVIALLEFPQARLFNRCFFGQFQLSFPAQRSGSSPLRSCRGTQGIPFGSIPTILEI
jgi:hypothetical protein